MSLWQLIKDVFEDEFTEDKQTQEPDMLTQLKDLFKKEVALMQTTKVSAMILNLLAEFNDGTLKAVNLKDDAIDCIIGLLQAEKSAANTTPATKA